MTTDHHELEKLSRELVSRDAAQIAHPGGTLLTHLERVHALLAQWGARPAVRLAGMCHAWYGTDGFAIALGDPACRDELTTVIGQEAERLVYFYASCDRHFSYPHLAKPQGPFKDRFTGAVLHPPLRLRRDFAELTAANELDIARANPDLRARIGPGLHQLFTSWRTLLSAPAWHAILTDLPATPGLNGGTLGAAHTEPRLHGPSAGLGSVEPIA